MESNGLRLDEKTPFQRFKIKLLSDLAFSYLHPLDVHTKKYLVNFNPEQTPAIYAMWHGYQWGLGLFPNEYRKDIHILVSPSNDGELIARVCCLLGFSLIRGSHQREGEKALREIVAMTKAGRSIAFMVDGPIGPKQKVKRGIIKIAKMAQVPIIPIVPYTANKICINSWDNYQIPTKINMKSSMIFGEPIYVPHDADEQVEKECRLKLENYMFELEKDVKIEHRQHWEAKNG